MKFNDFILSEKNKVLAYVVYDEHTLGYLFRYFGQLGLGVLGSKTTKGGLNWINGPFMITKENFNNIRKATKLDFEYFNVSAKGYIN